MGDGGCRSREQDYEGIIPCILVTAMALLLATFHFFPFIPHASAGAREDNAAIALGEGTSGNTPALLAGGLGEGSLTADLLSHAPGVVPGEVAIKIAEVGFQNRSEREALSKAEEYKALLHVSTPPGELDRKAGMGERQLAQEIREEIVAEVAEVAASENSVFESEVSGIVAGTLARSGVKGDMPIAGEKETEGPPLVQVTVVDPKGESVIVPDENIRFQVGSVVMVIEPLRSFTPGLYHVNIRIANPITGEVRELEQDFAWGVLAMNTDQDVYEVGQTADIHVGVLDDRGDIVGDAEMVLEVVAPDGSAESLVVPPTGTCGIKEVGFIEPDYRASYTFKQVGAYRFNLTATHRNGTRSISSTVEVAEHAPFIVRRVSATRNYPAGPTPMAIEVRFNEDFSGRIVEVVPESLRVSDVSPPADIALAEAGAARLILWEGAFRAGETARFAYSFEAPPTSPEFYTVGPLKVGDASERHAWQIANDLVESYIYGGASGVNGQIYRTHLPSGTSSLATTATTSNPTSWWTGSPRAPSPPTPSRM